MTTKPKTTETKPASAVPEPPEPQGGSQAPAMPEPSTSEARASKGSVCPKCHGKRIERGQCHTSSMIIGHSVESFKAEMYICKACGYTETYRIKD